jgi:hypothetical protein
MPIPKRSVTLGPAEDQILLFAQLGIRWGCHPKVAKKRVKKFGIPEIAFNMRVRGVRLSDVLKLEEDSTV